MIRSYLLLLLTLFLGLFVRAATITGLVTDDKGNPLPYSSILIKGTTRGVTAGSNGRYIIELSPGTYTIVCQYVGYTRQEKKVVVGTENKVVDFSLARQQLSMAEVVVRPGGEDPAYAIVRHAIKKRKEYETQLDSFTCEAYIKTLMKTRRLPKKVLGQTIDAKDKQEMGVDSAGRGIIYLSESLTKVAYRRPDRFKLEVLSGRESGSDGFGFNFPIFIDFYKNNVSVLTEKLNPRGFVSPIADAALNYYRYKFLGSYFEEGKEVNSIQVIPRRKYEPLFSGTIDIVEGEWRIHSLDLLLLRQSQLQILDTLQIKQIHAPVGRVDGNSTEGRRAGREVWQVRNQTVYFTVSIFGIDAVGNFVDVYNNYDINPRWRKKYFNNVLVHYDTAVNKKTRAYWDSIRPLPLEPDEKVNYTIRDSIYESSRDSAGAQARRDTLLKKQGPVKPEQLLLGFSRSNFKKPHPLEYELDPLLRGLGYNTVEGIDLNISGSVSGFVGGRKLRFSPHVRYGFHNTHLNAWGRLEDVTSSRQVWSLAGGKRVSQLNPRNPISELMNSVYTLLWGKNYMKIDENYFAELGSLSRFDNGLRLNVKALYEDRLPLANTTLYTWARSSITQFTPNYPVEKLSSPFPRHQAVVTTAEVEYQPGQRYIEYPQHKVSIGSKYPTFGLAYVKGWEGVLGSDVNFDKWRFSVYDDVDLKLRGKLQYRLSMGGFLNTRSVYIQDYQHFNGNRIFLASEYLNSFQLAPYYANSTTATFYATGHLEHHFNGFLTNKLPPFRQLNWFLVGGSNAFYVDRHNSYVELFGGMENMFKFLRVDIVASWMNGHYYQTGVRLGFGGLLSFNKVRGTE